MPGNPYGLVVLFDGTNPRTFTAKAREVISGGEFVFVSGAGTSTLSSGTDSYADGDIEVAKSASKTRFNGVALQNVASGAYVAIATRGSHIMRVGGTILGGQLLETLGDALAVKALVSGSEAGNLIGRAQTDGASGGFVLVDLKS